MPRRLLQKIPSWIIATIGVAVLVAYVVAFVAAVRHSLATPVPPEPLQPIVVHFLSTVNGMLAANLGASVGVSVAAAVWHMNTPPFGWLQNGAAVLYALIVLAAWIVWWKEGFTEDPGQIVVAIPEMCRVGLGILLGIFALSLGVNAPRSDPIPARPRDADVNLPGR